jgi:hypothetical protein
MLQPGDKRHATRGARTVDSRMSADLAVTSGADDFKMPARATRKSTQTTGVQACMRYYSLSQRIQGLLMESERFWSNLISVDRQIALLLGLGDGGYNTPFGGHRRLRDSGKRTPSHRPIIQ